MSDWIPPRPEGHHPDAEALYVASRHPTSDTSKAVLRHAAGCAECSEELLRLEAFDRPEPGVDVGAAWARFESRLSAEVGSEKGAELAKVLGFPAGEREGGSGSSKSRFGGRALALAASLLLAAGLAYFWVAERPIDETDTLRGTTRLVGAGFEPQGELAAVPRRFVFPAQAATPLLVSIRSVDGSYQWTSPATTTGEVELPEAERARLLAGVDYWWTVLGGAEVPAQRFRITPP